MLVVDLMVTLLVALLIGSVFVFAFGWGGDDRGGAWSALLFFVLIVWIATWAVGGWVTPVGPLVWGAPVVTFLLLAIVFALVLAAAAPARPRRRYTAGVPPAPADRAEESAALGYGIFFWILFSVLLVALVARYAT